MRRLLFVSYYFPPSGGSGVQRPLKFVKYLPQFGWEATILTVDPRYAAYSDLDPSMEAEIPPETAVIRTRARDPYEWYSRFVGRKRDEAIDVGFVAEREIGRREKISRWIRGNFFIPDARVGWIRYAVHAAQQELSKHSYDALFTTGPPHSSHLVGLKLCRRFKMPWIVDLRDAWPSDSYGHLIPVSAVATRLDRLRRQRVFDAATRIIAVSNTIAMNAARLTETPVRIVSNGFDSDDFAAPPPSPEPEEFTLVFAGHMPDEQNPECLWAAIKRRSDAGEWGRLRIHLVGNVSSAILNSIARLGLADTVIRTPYVAHSEAIRRIRGASVLLLTINRVPNPDGIVTGKLYEYLASGRPILCVGPVAGDAAEILRETKAGSTFEHADCEGIEREMDRIYNAWCRSEPVGGAPRSVTELFSRESQTRILSEILDEIST